MVAEPDHIFEDVFLAESCRNLSLSLTDPIHVNLPMSSYIYLLFMLNVYLLIFVSYNILQQIAF